MAVDVNIIKEVVFSERSTNLSEKENTYTFKVRHNANKIQIKEAVERAFNVKVADVRTLNVHPKRKVDRLRGIAGKTVKYKKAMVKLARDHKIEFA